MRHDSVNLLAVTKLADTSGYPWVHFAPLDIAFQADLMEFVNSCETSSSHFTLVADTQRVPICAAERVGVVMKFADTCENAPSHFTFTNMSLLPDPTLR